MTLVKDEGLTVNLTEFEKLTVKTITPPLEEYLKTISKTGDTCYNWNIVKPLLVYKLERVLDDFMDMVTENGDVSAPSPSEFQATKERLSGLLNGFYRAPFTVQRLLELLLEPNKHYRKFDKYARGLEKVLSVVTTVDPFPKKSPSSLLPNTVLNGNGLMRTVEDVGKKVKPLVNGDMENKPEECKKRSNVSDDRSPKRARVHENEEEDHIPDTSAASDLPMTTSDIPMTTSEIPMTTSDIPMKTNSEENGEETQEFSAKSEEESSPIQTAEQAQVVTATPAPVVMVTPDSTTGETPPQTDPVKSFAPNNHGGSGCHGDDSPTDDQVSTTTSSPDSETEKTPSLSVILSDHPSDHDKQG